MEELPNLSIFYFPDTVDIAYHTLSDNNGLLILFHHAATSIALLETNNLPGGVRVIQNAKASYGYESYSMVLSDSKEYTYAIGTLATGEVIMEVFDEVSETFLAKGSVMTAPAVRTPHIIPLPSEFFQCF